LRHRIALAAIALAAILMATALAAGRGSRTVDVGDNFFKPASMKIQKGTTVKFNWVGNEEHDVVKVKGPGPFFQSGPIQGSGVQYRHRFRKRGAYKLICSIHQGMGMKLEVK
jgi:plastocyanin